MEIRDLVCYLRQGKMWPREIKGQNETNFEGNL